MSSTFGGLETAKSGLSVAMANLNVTGHNIANVNTAGYTRQRLLTSAKDPAESTYLISQFYNKQIGQGVEIIEIQQIRSSYLDQQYRDLNSSYSYSENRTQALTYLEGLYNELDEESGLTSSIENYFSSLNTFSSDTSSEEYRTNVQQQALSMTQTFNNVYQEMVDLWNDQNDSISTTAQEINAIAEKLTQLNDSISSYERTGEKANDLRDERNLILDELSGLVNITFGNNVDNPSMTDVRIGGINLVVGTDANLIEIDSASNHASEIDTLTAEIAQINSDISSGLITAADGQIQIADLASQLENYVDVTLSANTGNADLTDVSFAGVSVVTGLNVMNIEDAAAVSLPAWIELNRNQLTLDGNGLSIEDGTLTGGQLYASMEMITEDGANNSGIPYYMEQLNNLVRNISENINTIHSNGWSYPDGAYVSTTGINFFEVPTATDALGNVVDDYSQLSAGNFTLSDEVFNSVFNIAGSSEIVSLNGSVTETGNNTIALQLFNDLGNNGYFSDLNSIVGYLAIALDTSESVLDTKEALINSVDTQRTSISGVSLDEETTNLIVFQQTYNACARMVTTIDEMLDTMINNMGLVGR